MSHDPGTTAEAPSWPPANARARRSARENAGPPDLPRPLTSLIGREADIAAVRAHLLAARVRLLTVTGPGGVGKTRLALAVAREVEPAFADGVVFVPLAAIRDHRLVLPTVARAFGLRGSDPSPSLARLARSLRDRHLLLVLDNAEQVAAAAPAVAALLAACPRLSALVTSRTRLKIDGEHRFPLAPLPVPAAPAGAPIRPDAVAAAPAVRLFVARAQAVEPRFRLDAANAADVADVCRRLDGLPLAIELAASRVGTLAPADLLARLDPMLPLLADGPADAPDRHRAMDRAIAWSYDLLGPRDQRLLRRLAVFVGGFSLAAASAVGVDGAVEASRNREVEKEHEASNPLLGSSTPRLLDSLAALIDASLLERRDDAAGTRFAMLETIHAFAGERLRESGELPRIAARHAAWCATMVEGVRRAGDLSRPRGLARLEAEQPNIRAALAWLLAHDDAHTALRLAGAAAEFWMRHGHLGEGVSWLERALTADHGPPSAARANALVGASMLQWEHNDRDEGLAGGPPEPNDFARSARLLADAEATARAVGDAGALAYARLHQGYVALFRGDLDLAEARATEALTTVHAIPQDLSLHGALWTLAEVAIARGDVARADERFGELLARGQATGDAISVTNALAGLARLADLKGDTAAALRGLADAAASCRESGDRLHANLCFERAAVALARTGRPEQAVRFFAAIDAIHRVVTGEPPNRRNKPFLRGHDAALAAVRAALPPDRFAALWNAGASLSADDAIADLRALAAAMTPRRPGARRPVPALTARERDVVRLLVEGRSDKEIAIALGISRRTASNHVAAIRDKLGLPSRAAVAAAAVRDGLL